MFVPAVAVSDKSDRDRAVFNKPWKEAFSLSSSTVAVAGSLGLRHAVTEVMSCVQI